MFKGDDGPIEKPYTGAQDRLNEASNSTAFNYDDILELNREIKHVYWKDALRSSKNPRIQANRRWFENRRKGYFYLTLGCPVHGKVLVTSAGSGIIADVLSSYFHKVVAVEYNKQFIDFMRRRFLQDRKSNIQLVSANATHLPFMLDTFDLIIVDGALNWVPHVVRDCDPRQTQVEFLEKCAAALKPGGKIAIAIENRFNFNYLLGATPNGDVPFTTVLPRHIANRLSLCIRGQSYRTYIYSYWGLRRLLKASGFCKLSIYIVSPTYQDPILIAPTQPNTILAQAIISSNSLPSSRGRRCIYIFLARLGVLKYFLHSFLITGEKRD